MPPLDHLREYEDEEDDTLRGLLMLQKYGDEETTEAANLESLKHKEDPVCVYREFTWIVKNIWRLPDQVYSDSFYVGGFKWRIVLFPEWNKSVGYVSLYLEVVDSSILPDGWKKFVDFTLEIVDQNDHNYSIMEGAKHYFNAHNSRQGFKNFALTTQLINRDRSYLVNDQCTIQANVWVMDFGCIGLKNQGTTCYLNSMIQTLYHIPLFRKAVYNMPMDEDIPMALQTLFYKMQHWDHSISTKSLTNSFGWDRQASFLNHDALEFQRVLFEKLDEKMMGTAVEGIIQKLFEGHYMSKVECIDVNHTSTHTGSFYGLPLIIEECRDVYDSFDKYVKPEEVRGMYFIEQYGLQKVQMGKLFNSFPPILQLQLQRFEYDDMKDKMVKINDRYEFPLQLDLDKDKGKYLSAEADRSVRNLFSLHSVLAHSGAAASGHYYAFIRPYLHQWFKFDDENVTKVVAEKALEDQYGGEEELPQVNNHPFKFTKPWNAYTLVYIRDSDKDDIFCKVDEKVIFEHIKARLEREKEKKMKEKAEADSYTVIKVAWHKHLVEHIQRDVFDLFDHHNVQTFRVQKDLSFSKFKEQVADISEIPSYVQRYWLWSNHRLNRQLQEEMQQIRQLLDVMSEANNTEQMLFLDKDVKEDFLPGEEKMLLFLKQYDVVEEKLQYVGSFYVSLTWTPMDIIASLSEEPGFSTDKTIEFFKESKLTSDVPWQHVEGNSTFEASQLEHGDILWCQTSPKDGNNEQFRDVPSFVKHVHNHLVVHFRLLENPKEGDFSIVLPKLDTYDDVVKRVAQQLRLNDPTKIRLTSHNCNTQLPEKQPIKYQGFEHLSDMLVLYNKTSHVFYYEVLDTPLPELQYLIVKIAFHDSTKGEVIYKARRLEQSTVEDVLNDLKSKVDLSYPDAKLRLLEISHHKIKQIIPDHEKLKNISRQLRAEEIAEKERNLGPDDRLIPVCHFWPNIPLKGTTQNQLNYLSIENFGDPFLLVILGGETLASIKLRIQKKLQVTNEVFSKWKFAFLSQTDDSEYLQDSDILSNKFEINSCTWGRYLGLEHADNGPVKQVSAVYDDDFSFLQNHDSFERPLKIDN